MLPVNCADYAGGDVSELNRTCLCLPLDRAEIDAKVASQSGIDELGGLLAARENLFAGTAVFVSQQDITDMTAQIEAIERAAQLDGYRGAVQARGGAELFGLQAETNSIMMGYDFHMTPEGPKLIEVNTNAGGALLVQALRQAVLSGGEAIEASIMDMFAAEWRAAGRDGQPSTIAIVDTEPKAQYLYPELLLAQAMFERRGITAIITDPTLLNFDGAQLKSGDQVIDMVYNRLTDFSLSGPGNAALRDALLADAAVISPAPRHHALYAHKANLAALTDEKRLRGWGLLEADIQTLARLPKTLRVSADNAEALWAQRKQYFFKPVAGFGSRAAYRGAKLTKRVWGEILAGDYVAQAFIAPSVRWLELGVTPTELKFDLRVFSYASVPWLYAARVYQGQTTNFRTKGGGLAPVICQS